MSFTPFLCSCEIVLCNLFGKILPSIILPRQGDGQMTYQALPIWNISHVMTNFTVLLISHLWNAGTRRLHGNCSCHRLLLLQFSLSLFKLPLHCKLNFFFHNVLKLLSVVGAWWSVTCIAGPIYFSSFCHFSLERLPFCFCHHLL